MIGLDTNVLLRVFIDDNPEQVAASRKLVSDARVGDLLISIVVLVECVWTLRTGLKIEKSKIIETLEGILTRSAFVVEDRSDVDAALDLYKSGRCDFADYLIAVRNKRLGADRTVSFDGEALRSSLFHPPIPEST